MPDRLRPLWHAMSGSPGAALAQHASVLRVPGVLPLLVLASIARLTVGMTGLAIVLRFAGTASGYRIAGSVTAAFVAGLAVGGPIFARIIARIRAPRLLLVLASLTSCLGIFAVSLPWGERVWGALPVALLAGIATPPISAIMRSLWPRAVSADMLPALYSLDATLVEVAFIVGPGIIGVISWLAGPSIALAICGLPGLLGISLLVTHSLIREAAAATPLNPSDSERGDAMLSRAFMPVLIILALAAVAFGMVEIAVVATISGTSQAPLVGLVFALASVGSVIGGLTIGPGIAAGGFGHLRWVLGLLSCVVATLSLAGSTASVTLTLAVANLLFTPAIGCIYVTVVTGHPGLDRLRAFSWMFSLQLGAISVGNLVAGLVIDHFATSHSFVMAGGCLFLASVFAGWAAVRSRAVRHTRSRCRCRGRC